MRSKVIVVVVAVFNNLEDLLSELIVIIAAAVVVLEGYTCKKCCATQDDTVVGVYIIYEYIFIHELYAAKTAKYHSNLSIKLSDPSASLFNFYFSLSLVPMLLKLDEVTFNSVQQQH